MRDVSNTLWAVTNKYMTGSQLQITGCLETNDGIKKYIFVGKMWDFPPVSEGHVV